MLRPTIFSCIFGLLLTFTIADDPCRFEDSSKGIIDLTSLAATNGKPAYADRATALSSNYLYSYNPCRPFSDRNCTNVAVCQISTDGQLIFPIGTQQSAVWNAGTAANTNPTISYTYQDKRAQVELICAGDDTDLFEALGEIATNDFRFRLTHKNACWKKVKDTCNPPCNTSCQSCIGGQCITNTTFCFIGKQCYKTNQTAKDEGVSCLQCQPSKNQTQWSFNPACSANIVCSNPLALLPYICPRNITLEFYKDSDKAVIKLYNFTECSQDRQACQAGFFLTEYSQNPFACCPGHFCPAGQVCMIPCRAGGYCPSPLSAVDGICQTAVTCPARQPMEFELYGCGGSTYEGFCPAGTYCEEPSISKPCGNSTVYCPTGVVKPLPCLSNFECIDGRVHRGYLYKLIFGVVVSFLAIYIILAILFQWITLTRNWPNESKSFSDEHISNYFRERSSTSNERPRFQLNIHLYRARLRDVTRFDPELNEGFTGCIAAGRITALMGGSGCGKSSLLDTIHGRRRLRDGAITFAQHEPLSNKLSDYIGYVPQADIMHNDLTVFETVYYSARTRRLRDGTDIIKQDTAFVLNRLGLSHMHNNMTSTLSGGMRNYDEFNNCVLDFLGQRKRVNVAMEVAACPKVLLLDEPTSGLDTGSCDDLLDLLQLIKYSADGPVAIIMVIHQPSFELFQKIDDIFFLTPLCCLAYQGPREEALAYMKEKLYQARPNACPPARHNDSDTCFIMLTKAQDHVDNHVREHQAIVQHLRTHSWQKRVFLPFLYVMSRTAKQIYVRGFIAEAAYLLAYFLLGACVGYLFENRQQDACSIEFLPTIYFLISLAFGILTCISSQRLFGVEIIDKTYERESRTHFHPIQYWLAKSFTDVLRLIFYPLIFLSMLYIQIVPRAELNSYFSVMVLLSFVCSGIGQLASVIFNRTEYAYLGGTIAALLSCLLSGFSPRKSELGRAEFFVTFSFSRHIQHLFYRRETSFYVQDVANPPHLWSGSVEFFREFYSYSDNEQPYFWLLAIGFVLRLVTFIILYIKSEYRSESRFVIANSIPLLRGLFRCEPCRRKRTASLITSIQL